MPTRPFDAVVRRAHGPACVRALMARCDGIWTGARVPHGLVEFLCAKLSHPLLSSRDVFAQLGGLCARPARVPCVVTCHSDRAAHAPRAAPLPAWLDCWLALALRRPRIRAHAERCGAQRLARGWSHRQPRRQDRLQSRLLEGARDAQRVGLFVRSRATSNVHVVISESLRFSHTHFAVYLVEGSLTVSP